MKSSPTRHGQVTESRWRSWRMVEVGGGGASRPPPTFTTSPTSTNLPLAARAAKRSYVRSMFAAIAPRYDLLNHLLSLNVDRSWRRAAVRRLAWERRPDGTYLDLCAGTLDLAATLARARGFHGTVVGADYVIPMLARGKGKAARARPVGADALTPPFADARFDGAMVAFGVRNLADRSSGPRYTYGQALPAPASAPYRSTRGSPRSRTGA